MRLLKITAVAGMMLLCAGSSFAAGTTAAEFYLELLQKGIAQYNAAAYAEAETLLRTAAFGLLEATDRYQTAQVYRTIVADKLNDPTAARDAARRVLAAERVQRTYASLALPAAVRTAFESVAKKILGAPELATLTRAAPPATQPQTPPPQTPPQQQPQTSTAPPATNGSKAAPPEKKPAVPETKPKNPPAPKPTPKPAPATTKPAEPVTPAPQTAAANIAPQLAAAEKTLNAGDLAEARRAYRLLLEAPITHEQALRIAEGLYRARDFANVLRAFDRAGALRKGEEPYRFYLAVAYYETGKFAAAKKELASALNYIELTPDVARYREKIEGAAD
jgi:outer membrane biosynthesis protein TonB